jgi:hypothetical protein
MSLESAVIAIYDEYLAAHPEGEKIAEVRNAIRDQVRELVEEGARDVEAEVDSALAVLNGVRRGRAKNLRTELDYLLDAFSEDGAYVDPMLNQAYPLGTADGKDRTLRNWDAGDLQESVVTHYRKAAESTAAATAYDQSVQRTLERMRVHRAARLGDVPWAQPPD